MIKNYDVIKEILISEKEFTETNNKRLLEALVYIKNNLIDSDGGIYLTVDSLIEINITKTDLNNIFLHKLMESQMNLIKYIWIKY